MALAVSYYVAMEFKILRRIAWEGELDQLSIHLDAVGDLLDSSEHIVEWNLAGDLNTATLTLELVVDAPTASEAEDLARIVVGEAIRTAGAMHEGLLSLKDESVAKVQANAWYGLRTPRWQQRRMASSEI